MVLLCSFYVLQEDANRGKPNWEHLSDDLHVLITVEDTENRAKVKLAQAVAEVQKLLVPVSIETLKSKWNFFFSIIVFSFINFH